MERFGLKAVKKKELLFYTIITRCSGQFLTNLVYRTVTKLKNRASAQINVAKVRFPD